MSTTLLTEANDQWMSRPKDQRFETLAELWDAVNGRRLRSRSTDIDLSRIEAKDHNGRLVINSSIAECEPSHWSFGQLATAIKAPAGYLRTLPKPLLIECLANGLKNAEREDVKFMTVTNEDGPNTLQAVTSTTYGRIWDADCVDAVTRIQERTNGRFFNPKDWSGRPSGLYASDHDVFMFMIDGGSIVEAGPRAQINRGFMVWNSETGSKSFGLMTFLFNKVCGNHLIWGATDVNKVIIRHTSGGPCRFDSQAASALLAYTNESAKPIEDGIKAAMALPIPQTESDLIEWVGKRGKFSRSEIKEAIVFAKSEEGQCATLWDLVQGFTAYARGFDFVDARIDLERRAGGLMNTINR